MSDEKKNSLLLEGSRGCSPLPFKTLLESPAGIIWQEHFKKQGFYSWDVTVARKKLAVKITPQDLQKFVDWDTSLIWDHFPSATDVLTLHGLQDETVPPWVISRHLKKRRKKKVDVDILYILMSVMMR